MVWPEAKADSRKPGDQGFSFLATRKPIVSNRTLILRFTRTAARRKLVSLRQEPPRACPCRKSNPQVLMM
jgi:hypothetical protein